MLHNSPFYNEHVRNTIVAFGTIFNSIQIVRTGGATPQTVNVPVSFGPREKWVRRMEEDPTLENQTYTITPRITFEITGYQYDSARKMNKLSKINCVDALGGTRKSAYAPVPWNINISMNILTKTYEDGLQIIEQILPYFSPEFTISINSVPELNVVQDIPVVLNSAGLEDSYDGQFENKRFVIHTLNFTLKTNFYAGMSTQGIINKATVNVTGNGTIQYNVEDDVPGIPFILDEWTEEL